MNSSQPPSPPRRSHRRFWLLLGGAVLLLSLPPAIAVTHLLRMGGDAEALCDQVMKASGVEWHTTVQVHAGSLMVGLAKLGLSFVEVPDEARPFLLSLHAVEVGVYQRKNKTTPKEQSTALAAAEAAMAARGWERLAGVVDGHAAVAVYLPSGPLSENDVNVCVMVLEKRQMVVVSARADLEPLLTLASEHLPARN